MYRLARRMKRSSQPDATACGRLASARNLPGHQKIGDACVVEDAWSASILDDVKPLIAEPSDVVEHPPQCVGGVALPGLHLVDHAHRVASSV